MTHTAVSIIRGIAACIIAVLPTDQVSEDDVFRVKVGTDYHNTNCRSFVLECTLPVRKLPARFCDEWQFNVTIESAYELTPADAETGESPAYMRCIADSEAVLAALYDWVALQDGIQMEPQPGTVDMLDTQLLTTRTLLLTYTRA